MLKAETNFLLFWLANLTLIRFGCEAPQSETHSISPSEAQQNKPEPSPEPLWLTDPTCCKVTPAPVELKEAWQQFVQDGHYRLAHLEDMKFRGGERVTTLYDFPWGDLGYAQITDADHLAAIVVDTTRMDDARFGLIIFSAPRSKNGAYVAHWLYRDRDLSRAGVTRASGELYVSEYGDDGSEAVCNVHWDKRQRKYVCD